jgi:hypothetical protein
MSLNDYYVSIVSTIAIVGRWVLPYSLMPTNELVQCPIFLSGYFLVLLNSVFDGPMSSE